jgi:cytochrome P450
MMMTLDQIDLADLDFFVNRDIHEAFRVLRREDPVHWQEKQPGRGFWSLTKYDDILAVYRDPLGFSSAQGVSLYFGEASQGQSGLREMMITTDSAAPSEDAAGGQPALYPACGGAERGSDSTHRAQHRG